ncbi:SAM-dependent methyltransferase [Streptomyces sp. JV178]|uniref:SAM-dependent methyltransferase n=1 Tax=Streptomyces sp. JV178 TaxID=858632 RepID=UPI00211E946A|nr:SAM-dependent methyltransferase [Streptomyces sp. JV178]
MIAELQARTSSARMQNYLLGGRDHYIVDPDGALRAADLMPFMESAVRHERLYVLLMVQALAIAGLRQLVDFGCGLPHGPTPVDVLTRIHPDARAVCVDNDVLVHTHAEGIMTTRAPAVVERLCADVRAPESILASREILETINWREPVILLLGSVLHHIEDTTAQPLTALVDQYKHVAATGSALVITHATADVSGKPVRRFAKTMTAAGCPVHLRTKEQIAQLFDGWQLTAPGLTAPQTLALEYPVPSQAVSYAGTARKEAAHGRVA